jgi:membrane protein DedA with SNARE-associated domain
MVAGSLKMPLWKYLAWSWPGKCLKMLGFALGGLGILNLF